VQGFVDRARADGAEPLCGGGRHERGGLYFAPTLLTNVRTDMEIAQNEVFGPVLTWHPFRDDAELVAIANATDYGLAATIFTRNERRASDLAAQVVAGTVWVNCFFIRELAAPFGGARTSGIGREGGAWSFDFFCDVKNVAIRKESFV
jgi:5-carboxymethyl-2-hydroxymuconic-semialdehyde dehydrogenase